MSNILPFLMAEESRSRLKELRKKTKGLTQEIIAEKCGVTVKTYRSWEKDISITSCRDLVTLADLFGVSLDYLIGRSNFTTPDNEYIGEETGLSDESIVALKENDEEYKKLREKEKESPVYDYLEKCRKYFSNMDSLSDEEFFDAVMDFPREKRLAWGQYLMYMDLRELVNNRFSLADYMIKEGYINRISEMICSYANTLRLDNDQSEYDYSEKVAMYEFQESITALIRDLVKSYPVRVYYKISPNIGDHEYKSQLRLAREEIRRYANSEPLIIEGEDETIDDEIQILPDTKTDTNSVN